MKYSFFPVVCRLQLFRSNWSCQAEGDLPLPWPQAGAASNAAVASMQVKIWRMEPPSEEEFRHDRHRAVAGLQIGAAARAVVPEERRAGREPARAQVETQPADAEEVAQAEHHVQGAADVAAVA